MVGEESCDVCQLAICMRGWGPLRGRKVRQLASQPAVVVQVATRPAGIYPISKLA